MKLTNKTIIILSVFCYFFPTIICHDFILKQQPFGNIIFTFNKDKNYLMVEFKYKYDSINYYNAMVMKRYSLEAEELARVYGLKQVKKSGHNAESRNPNTHDGGFKKSNDHGLIELHVEKELSVIRIHLNLQQDEDFSKNIKQLFFQVIPDDNISWSTISSYSEKKIPEYHFAKFEDIQFPEDTLDQLRKISFTNIEGEPYFSYTKIAKASIENFNSFFTFANPVQDYVRFSNFQKGVIGLYFKKIGLSVTTWPDPDKIQGFTQLAVDVLCGKDKERLATYTNQYFVKYVEAQNKIFCDGKKMKKHR
jgi:hypothetical protein